jgi:elongation factor Ts
MAITSEQVKTLREMTGVGMMDCKKALVENDGDLDAAVDWLRSRGLAKAAKKADRVAADGLIAVASKGKKAALIELNSETDFVARNEEFQALVRTIAEVALTTDGSLEAIKSAAFPGTGRDVAGEVTEAITRIGENMTLRRSDVLSVDEGVVGTYVHAAVVPNLGKIGILVGLKSSGDKARLETLGRQLAMHVAAAVPSPLAVTPEELPADVVAHERRIFKEQAMMSGKSAEIAEKMVEGRMRKYYEEVCLLAQIFVIDGESKISDVLKAAEKDVGAPITVTGFRRFVLGEGVAKRETDFAAEVAATVGHK